MEFTVGLDTIATLLTIVVGVLGLGGTVLASSARTRRELKGDINKLETELKGDMSKLETELKGDMSKLETELKNDMSRLESSLKNDMSRLESSLKNDIAKLDDRVYALAAGLAPRLAPTSGADAS